MFTEFLMPEHLALHLLAPGPFCLPLPFIFNASVCARDIIAGPFSCALK
jgi:hypothetical protein